MRRREGFAWRRLKKWDLPVLVFCSNAKVAVDGWEGGCQQKDELDGIKKMVARLYSTVLGNPKWKSRLRS
jgi:hypothetical protein